MTGLVVAALLLLSGSAAGFVLPAIAARLCFARTDLDAQIAFEARTALCTADSRGSSSRLRSATAGLGLAALAIVAGQSDLERTLGAAFLILLLGLFETDRTCLRLPDVMTVPLLAIGLGLGTLSGGIWAALTAAALGASSLWIVATLYKLVRTREGLGLGDVKMMSGVSAAVGMAAIPWVIILAALLGLALAILMAGGIARLAALQVVPFGCMLAVAGAIVWLST